MFRVSTKLLSCICNPWTFTTIKGGRTRTPKTGMRSSDKTERTYTMEASLDHGSIEESFSTNSKRVVALKTFFMDHLVQQSSSCHGDGPQGGTRDTPAEATTNTKESSAKTDVEEITSMPGSPNLKRAVALKTIIGRVADVNPETTFPSYPAPPQRYEEVPTESQRNRYRLPNERRRQHPSS